MGDEPSVHDNNIYAYSVDCENRRLILHTVFRSREPHEFTDVVFHDVIAHHFQHVLPGNILFDVEEVEVDALVHDNAGLFADSERYGWPINYDGDLDTLIRALRAGAGRGYEITSSYGMSGWVLAGSCQRLSRGEAAKLAGPA